MLSDLFSEFSASFSQQSFHTANTVSINSVIQRTGTQALHRAISFFPFFCIYIDIFFR